MYQYKLLEEESNITSVTDVSDFVSYSKYYNLLKTLIKFNFHATPIIIRIDLLFNLQKA